MWAVIIFSILLSASHGWLDESGRDTLCNRVYPSNGGKWQDSPPYWQIPNCPTQVFSPENVTSCMGGRTFYVIGNSIARQSAFNLVEFLGGALVLRENQKELCPKHETFWGDSCHQEYGGVKIRYLHLQFMDGYYYGTRSGFPFYRYKQTDPMTNISTIITGRMPDASNEKWISPEEATNMKGKFWAEDNCIKEETRQCLQDFFINSTEKDVLLFSLGLAYRLPVTVEEKAENDRKVLEMGEIGLDMEKWLISSAVAFKSHIAATFKGQTFAEMLSPLHSRKYLAYLTPSAYKVNEILYSLWDTCNERYPWYFIDQWSFNSHREHLYNDHIHFSGALSHASLYQMLNEVCPSGGVP